MEHFRSNRNINNYSNVSSWLTVIWETSKIMANHVYFTIHIEGIEDDQFNENMKKATGKRVTTIGNHYE